MAQPGRMSAAIANAQALYDRVKELDHVDGKAIIALLELRDAVPDLIAQARTLHAQIDRLIN